MLSAKMAELMNVLDKVKKYREILSSMIDFALIVSAAVVIILIINVFRNLWTVFYGRNLALGTVVGNVSILIIIAGVIVGFLRVFFRVRMVKVGEWKITLNEGAPGAIKLLEELKWETIFNDIRSAKLGISLYGLIKLSAYWTSLTLILYLWLYTYLGTFIHVSVNIIVTALVSLILALGLSNKDIRQRYEQMGHLDSLLWELRWFESEYRRADFKA